MANDKIEVDTQVLEDEIKNLKNLINDIETSEVEEKKLNGLGNACESMSIVSNGFEILMGNLGVMISTTVELFEDIKDGFLDADQAYIDSFNNFKKEVLKDE